METTEQLIDRLEKSMTYGNKAIVFMEKFEETCKGTRQEGAFRTHMPAFKRAAGQVATELNKARFAAMAGVNIDEMPEDLPRVSANAIVKYGVIMGVDFSSVRKDVIDGGVSPKDVTNALICKQATLGDYYLGFSPEAAKKHILTRQIIIDHLQNGCKDNSYEMTDGNFLLIKNNTVVTVRESNDFGLIK